MISTIIRQLQKQFSNKKGGIKNFKRNPFKVLVGTILSQRTRDENTEIAVKKLFSVYKNSEELANAEIKEIEKLIRNVGFYRNKANAIKEVANILLKKYNGKVPSEFEKLMELPSVGRKTANCVLVYGFGISAIPVDTHVHRISNRIGLVKTKNAEETEFALQKVVPKKYWIEFNDLFVKFGQGICLPRNPRCEECGIRGECKWYRIKP